MQHTPVLLSGSAPHPAQRGGDTGKEGTGATGIPGRLAHWVPPSRPFITCNSHECGRTGPTIPAPACRSGDSAQAAPDGGARARGCTPCRSQPDSAALPPVCNLPTVCCPPSWLPGCTPQRLALLLCPHSQGQAEVGTTPRLALLGAKLAARRGRAAVQPPRLHQGRAGSEVCTPLTAETGVLAPTEIRPPKFWGRRGARKTPIQKNLTGIHQNRDG